MQARHIVVEKDGNPVGALPNFLDPLDPLPVDRLVSVNPGRGGPVLSTSWEAVLDVIFEKVETLMGSQIVEHKVRTDVPMLLSLGEFLEERGYEASIDGKFVLRLTGDWEDVLAGMAKDRRYDIRKAVETDHEVRELELTESNVNTFYEDYCQKMNELGTPVLSRAFFAELGKELTDQLVLLTNIVDGQRQGHHLYLLDEYQSTIRHYLMTVTRDNYQYSSGELMHRHMIRRGLDEGWDRYDFGGSDIDFRDGGFDYKSQYGGELVGAYRWTRQSSRAVQLLRQAARRFR
ncbi:GNAT family N-acetyltransferase [Halovenus halobia]|uniref:GNAT family N-acetyltransferase n=1 Tax=Halovenus halobia TaxID=3396622 RepID=UPI003F54AE2B